MKLWTPRIDRTSAAQRHNRIIGTEQLHDAILSEDAQAQSDVFAQAYEIALQVVALREQHELTQAELAERCGMDQGDISRGPTSPTTRTLQRIAEVLDADARLARAS